MCSQSHLFTMVKNKNLVCLHNRSYTLRNNDARSGCTELAECRTEVSIRSKIKCGGSVIQDNNAWASHQSASDGQTLTLTTREVLSTTLNNAIKLIGFLPDKVCCLSNFKSFPNFLIGSVWILPAKVCANGTADQRDVLWNIANKGA